MGFWGSASPQTAATPEIRRRVQCCQCRGQLGEEHGAPERPQPVAPGRPVGWTLCPSCHITYRTVDNVARSFHHHCTHQHQRRDGNTVTTLSPDASGMGYVHLTQHFQSGVKERTPANMLCARCQDSDTHFECQTCAFRFCFGCSANCWDCRGQFCVECRSSHICTAPRRPRPWEPLAEGEHPDNLNGREKAGRRACGQAIVRAGSDTSSHCIRSDESSPALLQEHMLVSDGSDLVRFLAENAVWIRPLSRLTSRSSSMTVSTSSGKRSFVASLATSTFIENKDEVHSLLLPPVPPVSVATDPRDHAAESTVGGVNPRLRTLCQDSQDSALPGRTTSGHCERLDPRHGWHEEAPALHALTFDGGRIQVDPSSTIRDIKLSSKDKIKKKQHPYHPHRTDDVRGDPSFCIIKRIWLKTTRSEACQMSDSANGNLRIK